MSLAALFDVIDSGRVEEAQAILKGDIGKPDLNQRIGPHGLTVLMLASQEGHAGLVDLILQQQQENDVDINAASSENAETALFLAVSNGHGAVVRRILERADVDVNLKDMKRGLTPLHMAVKKSHADIIPMLLARPDLDVNARDVVGETPLHFAVRSNDATIGIARKLLERSDIQPNAASLFVFHTPLHVAAQHDSILCAGLLLSRKDLVRDAKCVEGRTALSVATMHGKVAVAKLLLDNGFLALINAQDKTDFTALHLAAEARQDRAVELLVGRGANVNLTTEFGETALSLAARQGDPGARCVDLLANTRAASVNKKDRLGMTALAWAAKVGCERAVRTLLERVDVDATCRDVYGRTVLHNAVLGMGDQWKVVRDLLSATGVDVNAVDDGGMTALHHAASCGFTESVKQLLARRDLDVNQRDRRSKTALHYASEEGQIGTLEALLADRNVDLNLTDDEGRTAREVAKKSDIVRLFPASTRRKSIF